MDEYIVPEANRLKLANCLIEKRKELHLGLNQVSLKLNITSSLYSRLENGKLLKINPFLIQKIAKGLKLDYKELYKIIGYLKDEDFKIYEEYNHLSKNNICGNKGNINLGEIINSKLDSKESDLTDDLTDSEKEQVRTFINFLKSQKK
ncbi:helix-turn-helix transcriptional regulator [Fusobacterium sp. IOR10]|uniref:helix-turn-helix domain-containing protein n=1 Tax=Fusobacterium sp. IOR10 TaxID=2665157 RepID=UPI0013D310C2|nr:helix-turn-helix transcriptional regulator [Fusobacterium sp. IOR10]